MPLFLLFHLMTHSIDLTIYNQLSKKKHQTTSAADRLKRNRVMACIDRCSSITSQRSLFPTKTPPALWQLFSDLLPILALHAGHQVIPIARMHMFHALDLAVGCRKGN